MDSPNTDVPPLAELLAEFDQFKSAPSEPGLLDGFLGPEPADPRFEAERRANGTLRQQVETLRGELSARDAVAEAQATEARERQALDDLSKRGAELSSLTAEEIAALAAVHFNGDADFREAWESGDETAWRIARDLWLEEIAERHPRDDSRRGLSAAVIMSRDVATASRGSGRFESVEWGKLSDSQFNDLKNEVFESAQRGELRVERARHIGGKVA
jgi:hypothetical protein